MDYLRRFYDISAAAGVAIPEAWETWGAAMRQLVLEQKAELWPIGANGEMIGGVLLVGGDASQRAPAVDVHVAVLPHWRGRWITKALRRAYDSWTHEVPVRAIVQPDNHCVIELATRLGFKFQADQGLYHVYVKEANHA